MPLRPWQRVVIAMFAVAWGANQFSPMLVVYRDELGLSPGRWRSCSRSTPSG